MQLTLLVALAYTLFLIPDVGAKFCRNVPGDPGFPTDAQWAALNASVSGRLVPVVPSAKFCRELPLGMCTTAQWTSSVFRNEIPGAMNQVNWEQDYDTNPPSLCLRDGVTCGQGNTPLFAILAEAINDIQAGVGFAQLHNLRLAIKASGHDYLGRSAAKSSLLISTHKLQNIEFTNNFVVGGKSKGTAVTVGSGVNLSQLYTAAGAQGKIVVGGTASTVVAAGGYVQGGGHSALAPLFGLAADNCLEIKVIIANGTLVTANEVENPDLFWAMRGGGAGSWGVTVSATFQTFSTFNIVVSTAIVSTVSVAMMGEVITTHARHIFDWDALHTSQYFYLNGSTVTGPSMLVLSYFPKATIVQAEAALEPFFTEARLLGAIVTSTTILSNVNKVLTSADDSVGANLVMGSRLIAASVYRDSPELVGKTYVQLLNAGASNILGNLVAGGKVAMNANISSAINPKWRTAKTHLIIANNWDDSASISDVKAIETTFRDKQLPILQNIAPVGSGAYSNEADTFERDFQTTFYGSNYARLSNIKQRFDPADLFIVRSGVGSERWDSLGLCKVS